jgi:hypothetical protein
MSPAHPAPSGGDGLPQGWMPRPGFSIWCPAGPDRPPGVKEVS